MKRGQIGKTTRKFISYGLIGLMPFLGCEKPSGPNPAPTPDPIPSEGTVYYKNVHKITNNDWSSITSYNNSTITFSDASKYSKGDILYSEPSSKAPDGFLKKIDKILGNNVYVSNSNLENMIMKGDISFNKNLTPNDFKGYLKNSNLDKNYNFHKEIDKVIYDADGDLETENDQIKLVGDFYFDLGVGINAKFNSGLESVSTYSKLKGELDLNLEGQVQKEVSWKEDIFKIKFAPIVIAPGVVATPKISGALDLEAAVKGEFSVGANLKNINEQKILYQRGSGWSHPVNTNELTFEKKDPKVSLIMNSNSGLSERVSLLLYGISGPFVEAREYLKFHSNINENPWWKLYGGLELNAGLDAGLLARSINDYSVTLFQKEKLISQAESSSENHDSYKETFEDNLVNSFPSDWIADANASTTPTKNIVISENGNHVLQLYGAMGDCWGSLAYHERKIEPPYDIKIKIKNGTKDLYGCHQSRATVGLRNSDSWTGKGLSLLNFKENGDLYGAENTFVMNVPNGKWNDYKIEFDETQNGNYNVNYYVNDTLRKTIPNIFLPLNYKNYELSCNEGYAYFDDLEVIEK